MHTHSHTRDCESSCALSTHQAANIIKHIRIEKIRVLYTLHHIQTGIRGEGANILFAWCEECVCMWISAAKHSLAIDGGGGDNDSVI